MTDRIDLRRLTVSERCEVLELLLRRLGLKVVRAEPGEPWNFEIIGLAVPNSDLAPAATEEDCD